MLTGTPDWTPAPASARRVPRPSAVSAARREIEIVTLLISSPRLPSIAFPPVRVIRATKPRMWQYRPCNEQRKW